MAKSSKSTALTLHARAATGTTGAKKARREGLIPGAIYGHGGAQPISIDIKALSELLASGGVSHVVDATIDGKNESVLLREVQRDPITHRPIAANFQRVTSTEAITATISIVTTGVAAGVKDHGGVMDVVTHALDVKGPAGSLPEQFELDVTKLGVHEHITAGQVPLPKGFTLLTPPDTIVVSIESSRTAGEAAESAPAPAAETAPAAAPAASE